MEHGGAVISMAFECLSVIGELVNGIRTLT